MATRIDTLRTYDAIAAAGVDEKAARAISNAIAESAADYRADLVTKSDMETLRTAMKSDIDVLRTGMKSDIDTVKGELRTEIAKAQVDTLKAITDSTRWNVSIVLAVGAVVTAVVKYL